MPHRMDKYDPLNPIESLIAVGIIGTIMALAVILDVATGTKHLSEMREKPL